MNNIDCDCVSEEQSFDGVAQRCDRHREVDELSDLDQSNPVDVSADTWARIYSDPDYDLDHDHSMDY